jgi:pyrimidine-specific ribonucleoside hydrolase
MTVRPTIIDSDAGTDPDDTCVAIVVTRHPALFGTRLMVTNDETTRWAKARFLAHIVAVSGGGVPVAGGLPSLKKRVEDLAEKAGLAPDIDVDCDGVTRIIEVLEAHDSVDYIGLGALTNLDAALTHRPELASRVRLFQMGPAVANGFGRARAQYNARIDPAAFVRVLQRVPLPTLIATHTTWGNWCVPTGKIPLGVYPDDDLGKLLISHERPDLAIYGRHLAAFVASGKDCSILHDPATLLASREPELFDLVEVEVIVDEDGWLHFTRSGLETLCALETDRKACVERAIAHWKAPADGEPVRVRLSLGADYAKIRARVIELLGV